MQNPIVYIMVIFTCLSSLSAHAYNLRQINSINGLSNSSVICIMQDDERFLWIGTYDGLNVYDGHNIRTYKPAINNSTGLSSNVIRKILETSADYIWLSTKWGLNKFNQRRNSIEEYYEEFNEDCHFATDTHSHLYILGHTGFLSLYQDEQKKFINLPIDPEITKSNVSGMTVDEDGIIWILYKGTLKRYSIHESTDGEPTIMPHADFMHKDAIDYLFKSDNKLIIVDQKGNIFEIKGDQQLFICNIEKLMMENGGISSIIYDNEDILIAFNSNGLIRLNNNQGNYLPERIRIDCGVFSLWKDQQQDIVWIGTDGQGVYAMTKDEYTFNGINLTELPIEKKRPVRAVYADDDNNLWLGTKDNGIIHIKDYQSQNYSQDNVIHYTTANGLSNNAIFAFASTPNGLLWIGSDGPNLNYYNRTDHKIHTLENRTGLPIKYVHSILTDTDSLLWVGAGNEIFRIRIGKNGYKLYTDDIDRYTFNVKNKHRFNQIYALCFENDSIMWIGMRGNGIIRFNTQTSNSKYFSFEDNGIAPMNDVLCFHYNHKGTLWIGTSYGLIRMSLKSGENFAYENINETHGLPNNTIHGITEDHLGKLWLSTNAGLILFDPEKRTFRNFNNKSGIKVVEYSDNAYFKRLSDSSSFFGGVNGLVWINKGDDFQKKYQPEIYFTGLRIFNKQYNISDFEKQESKGSQLVLKHRQNFFTIQFVAMDFINGENGTYSYKLENFSNVWMHAQSNEAQFTNISPGEYILHVKYNDGLGTDIPTQSIAIQILPPWYSSIYAQIIYVMLIGGGIWIVYLFLKRKYKQRKVAVARQLTEKYKEEMYESKLRFFTNITHEFCTPLSLIYGPCIRIIDSKEASSSIKKYANLIKSNTERLNGLIQEIIDFRRMETGNKICVIKQLPLGIIVKEMMESFTDISERNHIEFEVEFDNTLIWNSDESCFVKIANNLLSNAFKYTPPRGTIRIRMYIAESKLIFSVYNTGKGIPEKDISNIFNRYTILDNITENSVNELSARNGLGLAIAYSMAELLKGTIEVESIENDYTCFTVTLPYLEVDSHTKESPEEEKKHSVESINSANSFTEDNDLAILSSLPSILVIDDNKDILWMIKDIFREEYTVLTAENAEEGMKVLKKYSPVLVITDIMMPGIDGITLTRQIKQNQHLMHIPIIILSAKNDNNDKVAGVNSGADIYITKPFDVNYLKTVVTKLLEKSKNLETYYSTSASAFEFISGQLVDREDKELMEKAIRIIAENISNNEFTPQELASSLQISIRNLYRKFEQLNLSPPKNFIKEQRINFAAKLLVTTSLTIEEIMYRSGFMNRSHFYKEFIKRMEMAPKDYRLHHKK